MINSDITLNLLQLFFNSLGKKRETLNPCKLATVLLIELILPAIYDLRGFPEVFL
jgi:hypothetical protein